MTLDDLARRFDAKQSSTGYRAQCPVHEDDTASLSISQSGDKLLIHCHAGCKLDAILSAKNLTTKDLFERRNGQQRSPIVATYDYRDLTGKLRYRKQRTADKRFWFERPGTNGDWITNMQGVEHVIYRLNDLREQSAGSFPEFRVYLVEGEKDADRLWSLGLPATTNDDGASEGGRKPKWKRSLTQQLKAIGATEIICLPDSDEAGRAHMRAAAQSCQTAGLAVRLVDLPGEHPKGYDVSDWLDAGHPVAELIALCEAAESYVPPPDVEPPVDAPSAGPAPMVTVPRTLAEVHAEFSAWLGEDYDLGALDAVLAAAAAERLSRDPLWLLIISGPGHAKTETVQALSGVGAICVSTIASEGALLSASPKRERSKDATGGLLRQIGTHGILVVKDMTSILSMQSNTRAPMLSALREIHDGKWVRTVGTDGGKTMPWAGRIVVIGACTTAWDTHHTAIAAMGDRFVLVRMNSHLGRDSAGRQAIENTGREIEMREALADAVAGLLQTVEPQHAITLTKDQIRTLLAAANITALCRTGVEYDYRGEPIEAHMPEMPTRFAKQLTQVIRGGVALGMTIEEAMRLAIRCARDSMPPIRLAILADLWEHPWAELAEMRARLNMPRSTVKRQLESLYLLQVLTCIESTDTIEASVEVGDNGSPKKRTMKKRTLKRYAVVPALRAEALGLRMAEPGIS